jgi:hypothetical protein
VAQELFQRPPEVALASWSVPFSHTLAPGPVIGATTGEARTVIVAIEESAQLAALETLYLIVVVPADRLFTKPPDVMLATVGLLLLHTPAGVVLLN